MPLYWLSFVVDCINVKFQENCFKRKSSKLFTPYFYFSLQIILVSKTTGILLFKWKIYPRQIDFFKEEICSVIVPQINDGVLL